VDRGGICAAENSIDRAGKGKAGKRKKRPAGLEIIERDGHWHVHGTISVGGHSKRVRRSLGLAARPDTRAEALHLKRQIEAEYVAEIVYGIKPSRTLGVAAYRYLERSALAAFTPEDFLYPRRGASEACFRTGVGSCLAPMSPVNRGNAMVNPAP